MRKRDERPERRTAEERAYNAPTPYTYLYVALAAPRAWTYVPCNLAHFTRVKQEPLGLRTVNLGAFNAPPSI